MVSCIFGGRSDRRRRGGHSASSPKTSPASVASRITRSRGPATWLRSSRRFESADIRFALILLERPEEAFGQPVHPLPGRQLRRRLGRDGPSSRFVLGRTMDSRATFRGWRGCRLSSLRRAVGERQAGSYRLAKCSGRGGRRDIARSLADVGRRRRQGAASRDPVAAGKNWEGRSGGGSRARPGGKTGGRPARCGTRIVH